MIDIDPASRFALRFHTGYPKDSMHAKLAGTLRQIGNFGEGMVLEPRPKLANFTYSCQPSIEARCGLQINSGWLPKDSHAMQGGNDLFGEMKVNKQLATSTTAVLYTTAVYCIL